MLLGFESVAPGEGFQFDPDCIQDGNDGMRLAFKSPGKVEQTL
jgi:hypothetical protein